MVRLRSWTEDVGYLAFGVLLVVAIVHMIRTRTLHEFLVYSMPIAVAVAISLVIVGLVYQDISDRKNVLPSITVGILAVVAIGFIAGIVYYALGAAAKDAFTWLLDHRESTTSNPLVWLTIVTLALLVVAGTLFYFRLHVRSVYGLSEVVVGIGIGLQQATPIRLQESVASSIGNRSFLVPMLTASIYLIVRGLDNVHQGFIQKPPDPVATAIVGKLQNWFVDGKQ